MSQYRKVHGLILEGGICEPFSFGEDVYVFSVWRHHSGWSFERYGRLGSLKHTHRWQAVDGDLEDREHPTVSLTDCVKFVLHLLHEDESGVNFDFELDACPGVPRDTWARTSMIGDAGQAVLEQMQ